MTEETEIAVIGAGVVGLAIAAELSRSAQVVVLERHEGYGRETSSHNSGVVHAGIYYPRDWLKTQLCIEGNALLYEWAAKMSVRAHRVGKLVIATDASELSALEQLFAAAGANGVKELQLLSQHRVRQLEPSVRAVGGFFSATSGVIDQMQLMQSLLSAAQANGALPALKHEVLSMERDGEGFLLAVGDPDGQTFSLKASIIVNADGLTADRLAAMLGYPLDGEGSIPRLRQTINKGRYYDIVNPQKAALLRHLIYPLPHNERSGLGVHVTLDVDQGRPPGPRHGVAPGQGAARLSVRRHSQKGLRRSRADLPALAHRRRYSARPGRLPRQAARPWRRPGRFLDLARPRLRASRRDRVARHDRKPRHRASRRSDAEQLIALPSFTIVTATADDWHGDSLIYAS